MSVKIEKRQFLMDNVKIVSECIRKVKQLEQKNDLTKNLINGNILLESNLLLTPPSTEPDSPASDEQNKDFQDFIEEIPDENTNLSCLSNDHVNTQEKNKINNLNIKNIELSNTFVCKWTNCDWPGCDDDLVDHIREIHVELQPYHYHDQIQPSFQNIINASKQGNQTQTYVCLWKGCKVYGKASLCKSWLENHVLQHSGPRPFKCIFEGCGQRFKTRALLEKHVNNHFTNSTCDCKNILECRHLSNCDLINMNNLNNHTNHTNHTNSLTMNGTSSSLIESIGSASNTPIKCSKKKKNTKLKRRLPTVRSSNQDLFDECTMHHLKYSLMQLNSITGLDIIGDQRVLTFHAKIIGKCQEGKTGAVKLLLHWEPEDIIDDTWVPEDDANKMLVKKVPLSSLPVEVIDKIGEYFFPKEKAGRKQKRK